MTDVLFSILVNPLEVIYQFAYEQLYLITRNYGIALLCLSVLTAFITAPLEKIAGKYVEKEKKLELILNPQITRIKIESKGAEQSRRLHNLYYRYNYNPIYSIRSAFGVLLQLPFLLGAYWMLSSFDALDGVGFAFISDLSRPDGLLFGYNLLPFVMTIVNLGATTLMVSLTKRDRIQAYLIAFVFLLLLYAAPASLLVYWTGNNCIFFIKVLLKRRKVHLPKLKLFRLMITQCRRVFSASSSSDWLIPLAIVTPNVMLWSSNIHQYTKVQLFSSVLTLGVISATSLFLCRQFHKTKIGQSKYAELILIVLFSLLLGYFADTIIAGRFYDISGLVKLFILVVCILIFHLLSSQFLVRLLSFMLVCSIVASTYGYMESNLTVKDTRPQLNVELTNKPNIYLLLCESYNNFNTINELYHTDFSDFLKVLERENFHIYNNVYSNMNFTLGSLMNLFTFSDLIKTYGQGDASFQIRKIIAGGEGNYLFKILKENDYETSYYIRGDSYFFRNKGIFLDYSDVNKQLSLQDFIGPILDTNRELSKTLSKKILYTANQRIEKNNLLILKKHMKRIQDIKKPQFFMLKVGADHTPSNGSYNYIKREEWINSGTYQQWVSDGNQELKLLINEIISKDPQSVIILLGDHGSWLYRDLDIAENFKELQQKLSKEGVTFSQLIRDKYHVFAAIRLPDGAGRLEEPFSHANLFLKIFKVLNPHSKELHEIPEPPNNSWNWGWGKDCVVKDGSIKPYDMGREK